MTETTPDDANANAGTPASGDDSILPFQLDGAGMRGRVARLDRTLNAILGARAYPTPVAALVSEATLLTALIGQTMKLRWRLSLQVRGEGAIRLIATDYFAPEREGGPARIRAYAGFDPEALDPAAPGFRQLGAGVVGVTIDQGPGMAPYQGVTPLTGGALSGAMEAYFAQSEQLATSFAIETALSETPGEAAAWRGGGVMIQQLPSEGGVAPDAPAGADGLMSAGDAAALGGREDDWRRVSMLLATMETHELIGPIVPAETLLLRLFHEEAPRVWPAQPVRFGCTCSAEKVEAALAHYSAAEIAEMITAEGKITADCQFCGASYALDPSRILGGGEA
ncbi:Hsp33 family molecular chaperone HslO [Pikeienuella sp. HZG-20]|uniref:Hsp33 family molecular chaperone HslO n=1 Tax=Paludibacillus litoralis TaxID=3133267 RepID=UPI0030EC74CD